MEEEESVRGERNNYIKVERATYRYRKRQSNSLTLRQA